jgi:chorismate mutase
LHPLLKCIMNILPLAEWLDTGGFPLIISGPCSAETEEQVLSTARDLACIPWVKVYRAGLWKPRTRPGGFQGVGTTGLSWLKEVKRTTGLLTAIEVAKPSHIIEAIENEVDILWVGARTVVNPFSIQEIADALQGIDIPVMVKNPLNPDIKLWIGALERLNHAGIRKLIAIHRGFFFFERSPYRNAPMWEIPIELNRLYPDLPIICDPSHICGKREHLESVSQKALDLEMAGLMIESHIRPLEALSDADQQITPGNLEKMLAGLVIRKQSGTVEFQTKLEGLRAEIDKIDRELLDILSRRMRIVEEIGEYKKENDITILQIRRWRNIIQSRLETGLRLGLGKEFLLEMLELVHRESIHIQAEIMNARKKKSK